MFERLSVFMLACLLILSASSCNQGEQSEEEADVDATVGAALQATQAAAPTNTITPTDTAPPPTDTPVPSTEQAPIEEPSAQVLDLNESPPAFSPSETNYATDLNFRLEVDDEVVNNLEVEGVTNVNGDSSITYDFSNADVPEAALVTIYEVGDDTYFSMPNGVCVSTEADELPIGQLVSNAGATLLDTENMVTGQLEWNGTIEVNGVVTNEYLIEADNLTGATGLTNMTRGVLNVAEEGDYVVRLVLEGRGASDSLAPGVQGNLYYELNLTPSETPFEIELPAACNNLGGAGDDTDDGDTADSDTGDDASSDGATDELVISQVSQSVSHQCQDENVVVEGASNTISLSGTCNELIVNSAGNTIEIEAAAAIIVEGAGNTITYSGSPAITDNGIGNQFIQR